MSGVYDDFVEAAFGGSVAESVLTSEEVKRALSGVVLGILFDDGEFYIESYTEFTSNELFLIRNGFVPASRKIKEE